MGRFGRNVLVQATLMKYEERAAEVVYVDETGARVDGRRF